jgi:hypothetical protein
MPVHLEEQLDGKTVEVTVTGKLTHEDYQLFVPVIEELISEHGKLSVLVIMHDFHGWHPAALWDDIRFDAKHFRDIEKLAIVGETKWEQGMAAFCKPFTTAEVRYFDHTQLSQAKDWLLGAGVASGVA